MKKLFITLSGFLLIFSWHLMANIQYKCMDALMEYSDELNQLNETRNAKNSKIFYQKVKSLVEHCKNADVDDDFDQDGFQVYGLKHLEEYASRLLQDKKQVQPANHYVDAEDAKLISFDSKKNRVVFEIMDYVQNRKENIELINKSDIQNMTDNVGGNARIKYDATHNILTQVVFYKSTTPNNLSSNSDMNTLHYTGDLPGCKDETLLEVTKRKVQKLFSKLVPAAIEKKSYDASGHRILSDEKIAKMKKYQLQMLAQLELRNVQTDGTDPVAKMRFCRADIFVPESKVQKPVYFDIKKIDKGEMDIKLYFEGNEKLQKAYRYFERNKEECKIGDQQGCHDVAEAYLYGVVAPQSYEKALKFFQQPCKSGIAHACTQIGFISELSRDLFKAVTYYQKGCKLGDEKFGCSHLGIYYAKGIAVKQDIKKAKELFAKGCEAKNATACQNYASVNQ